MYSFYATFSCDYLAKVVLSIVARDPLRNISVQFLFGVADFAHSVTKSKRFYRVFLCTEWSRKSGTPVLFLR